MKIIIIIMALSFPSLRINQSVNKSSGCRDFLKIVQPKFICPSTDEFIRFSFIFFFQVKQIGFNYLFIFFKSLPVVSSDQPDRNVSALRYAVLLVLITRELHQRDNHCFYIITCSQTVDKAGDHSITSTLHVGPFIFCFFVFSTVYWLQS